MIGGGLKCVRQQQDLRLSEELAGEVEPRWRAVGETTRKAQRRVAGAVGQSKIAPDEQVEVGHGLIHLFHHPHPEPVALDELHRGREAGAANFVRPAALLGAVLGQREVAASRDVIEGRRRLHVAEEVDGLEGQLGKIEFGGVSTGFSRRAITSVD